MQRAVVAAVVISACVAGFGALLSGRTRGAIVVGSKNFTEQIILGELVAQAIERYGPLPVNRKLNLGGSFICDRALLSGDIDLYVEYSGTALTAIFHEPVGGGPAEVFERVRERYGRTGRTLLSPLGFNNTFAILVRQKDAERLKLRTISDAVRYAPRWRAGFGYEFLDRADGYAGLARVYGLRFATEPRAMDLNLTYRALANGQVDLIAGDATAGLIEGLHLFMLEDDKHYFPPYDAAPVARAEVVLREPAVSEAMRRLAGHISARQMRRLNYLVDAERQDPAQVVRTFLNQNIP
jgi:glycine betaine/choline ABC-type transport system substrate-binding protein